MDNSLAKGIKNQLFREIGKLIQDTADRWLYFLTRSKVALGRKQWEKSVNEISKHVDPFLISLYVGGSKRKPFLCIATLENDDRLFNSWQERCVRCILFYFSINPIAHEVIHMGFNLSEHAIMRIFERVYSDKDPLGIKFKTTDFVGELKYAPLWSVFWTTSLVESRRVLDIEKLDVIIPSPNGVLLGNISYPAVHVVELRTFLSQAQLNSEQRNLLDAMREISDRLDRSIFPFLLMKSLGNKEEIEKKFDEFLSETKEIRELLRQLNRFPMVLD